MIHLGVLGGFRNIWGRLLFLFLYTGPCNRSNWCFFFNLFRDFYSFSLFISTIGRLRLQRKPQDMLFRAGFALFLFVLFGFSFSFSLIRRMALYCMVRLTDESMPVEKKKPRSFKDKELPNIVPSTL